jgi:hypothetical protein
MNVSISDMASTAADMGPPIQISSEIGNVIEVTDMSDDLGLNLIANQTKMRDPPAAPSFGSEPIRLSVSEEAAKPIEFDSLEPISLNIGGGSSSSSGGGSMFPEISISKEPSPYSNLQSSSAMPSINLTPAAPRNLEMERQRKTELLNKLQRLEAKGFPVSKRFTNDNTLEEIEGEYNRLVDAQKLEASLRFQRQMLMGAITGLEFLNNKFDPFDIKLEGWSESVHTNVEDFDEIFEELYDKYKNRANMPPEMRLLVAVAGSGFMCHVSNSFFRSKMPSMDDVLRSNPMLAKQMAAAAAQQAGPGFGNFMGMAMNVPPSAAAPPPVTPMDPPGPTGAFFGASGRGAPNPSVPGAAPGSAPTIRREMKGPSGAGVDDILKTFQEVRQAEMESIGRAPPPVFNTAPVSPTNQPAMVAVSELQSVVSDEMSQAETIRTAGGSRRRGGRRGAAPVGNMVAIDA